MSKEFVCDDSTIVTTKAGKLQGFKEDSTYIFQGIKYADAKRFQMPTPVEPWKGVRPATNYGYVAPLLAQETPNGEIMVPHKYWPMDENCQYLNIWTQTLDASAKKAVMVWLHGGGFTGGSSIEEIAYEGRNLSAYGDVVVVTLNHRLNVLGYLDLSYYSEKYKNSGNAGNADIVAALVWVRENIAQFGGDPDNVTLFGQSGGGMKIWHLMQTPAADGLFHKGIIQSGILDGFMIEESSQEISLAIMQELGIDPKHVEELETVPFAKLAEAHNKIYPSFFEANKYAGINPSVGDYFLGDPREVGFTEHAKTIPVMIGTTFGGLTYGRKLINKHSLTEEDVIPLAEERYGADFAGRMIEAFKKAYPKRDIADVLSIDCVFRMPAIKFIRAKSEFSDIAPTYAYIFELEFPLDGGRVPWHCSEIPFVFHNTELVPVCNIPGVSDKMEAQMFGAWTAFAKTGNPNCDLLPEWPACEPGKEATMIFNRECDVRFNFDHELIDLAWQRPPRISFLTLENKKYTPEMKDLPPGIYLH